MTDAVSLEFLRGAVIEFEDSLMRSAFQVWMSYSLGVGLQGGYRGDHSKGETWLLRVHVPTWIIVLAADGAALQHGTG